MVAFTRPPEDVHGQDTEFFINMSKKTRLCICRVQNHSLSVLVLLVTESITFSQEDNSHHLGRDGVADGGYTVFGRVEAGWSAVKR